MKDKQIVTKVTVMFKHFLGAYRRFIFEVCILNLIPVGTIFAGQLPSPQPIAPLNESYVRSTRVCFDWSDVEGGTSYYLKVDDLQDFTFPEIESFDITVSSYCGQLPAFSSERTYWWQLQTWDGAEWGPVLSSTPSFSVDVTSPVFSNYEAQKENGSWVDETQWIDISSPSVRVNVQDSRAGLRIGQAPLPVSSSTVLMLHFDEPDGNSFLDYSGYGSSVTNQGAGLAGSLSSDFDTAISFADNGYLTVKHAPNLSFTNAGGITVEAWVKPSSVDMSGMHRIIEKVASGKGGFALRQYNNSISSFTFHMYFPGIGDYKVEGALSQGFETWYHVAGTYDNKWVRLYINGKLMSQIWTNMAIQESTSPLCLAANNEQIGQYQFHGMLDEVRLLNRALSAEEIALDYNSVSVKYSTDGGTGWVVEPSISVIVTSGVTGTIGVEFVSTTALPFVESGNLNKAKFLAMDRAGNWTESDPFTVKIDTTPPSPNPPVWNALKVHVSSIAWNIGVAADGLSGLNALPYSFDGGNTWQASSSTIIAGLEPNTLYYATATVKDIAENITMSHSTSVYTLANTPANLVLTTSGLSIELAWNANGNPGYTAYSIYRSTDNFINVSSNIISFADIFTPISYTDSSLWAGATFYYRVKAKNEVGKETGYSNIMSAYFPITAEQLPPPQPLYPLDNSYIRDQRICFDWSDVAGGTSYYLRVANNQNLEFPIVSANNVMVSSFCVSSVFVEDTYWWQLRTGNGSEWGPPLSSTPSFSVDVTSPVFSNYETQRQDGSWVIETEWVDRSSPSAHINVQDNSSGLKTGQSPLIVTNETVLMLRFNESENSLSDYSRYGSGVINSGGARLDGLSSAFGTALNFDGNGSYVTVQHAPHFDFTNASGLTVEAWVRPSASDLNSIIEKYEDGIAGKGGFVLRQENNIGNPNNPVISFKIVFGPGGGVVSATSTFAQGLDTWYHVVGTYDKQNVRIYINGKLERQTATTIQSIYGTNNPLVLATKGNSIGDYPFHGMLDEVRLLNRALSAEEVALDYNSASVKYSTNGGTSWVVEPSTNVITTNGDTGTRIVQLSSTTALPFDESANLNKVRFLAMDTAGNWTESDPFTVKIDTTPPSPNPPVWNEPQTHISSITWNISSAIDNVSGLNALPYSFDGGLTWQAANSATTTGLAANTLYIATAAVRDTVGNVAGQVSISTYTLASPPVNLVLSVLGELSIQLTWDANGNPANTAYAIYRSTNNFVTGSSAIVTFADNFTPISYTDSSLWAGATFYYKVKAKNEAGRETVYSNIVSAYFPLTIQRLPPPQPIAPLTGSYVRTTRVCFDWSDVEGGTNYYLRIASDQNLNLLKFDTSVSVSSYCASTTFVEGAYWWQLQTGNGMEWGPVLSSTPSFTVDVTSPVFSSYGAQKQDGSWIDETQWIDNSSPSVRINIQDARAGLRIRQAPLSVSSGTVLMLHFDEPDVNSIFDYSGYGSSVTNNGGTMSGSISSDFGTAINFAGNVPYLTVQHAPNLDFTNSSGITVEAWIKPSSDDMAGTHSIIEKYQTSSGKGGFLLRQDEGAIVFHIYFYDDTDYIVTGRLFYGADVWHHVVGTYDKQKLRIYINGKLEQESPLTLAIPGAVTPLVLASSGDQTRQYPFHGMLDEVRLLKRALSAEEIALDYNSASVKYSTNGGTSWVVEPSTSVVTTSGNNGTTEVVLSSTTALPFGESANLNKVKFLAMDRAGNWVESSTFTVKIDTTPPSPNPPAWNTFQTYISSITWNLARATDSLSGLNVLPYSFDGGISWQASTSTKVTGLEPNTLYTATAAVRDATGNVTALLSTSSYTLAKPPLNLTVSRQETVIQLSWDANGNPSNTAYAVYRSTNNFVTVSSAMVTFADNHTDTSYTDSSLWGAATFYYKIKARNATGIETAFSNAAGAYVPLISPYAFTGTTLSTTTIIWSWQDISILESGYRIYTATSSTLLSGDLPAGATYWLEAGLSPNSKYTRYVQVFTQFTSSRSSTASATTFANPPTALSAIAKGYSSVDVSWSPGYGGNTNFVIQRAYDGGSYVYIKDESSKYTKTSILDSGLKANATYYYRVAGYNAAGVLTGFSPVVAVQTPYKIIYPPAELAAISIGNWQIKLEWLPSISSDVTHYRIYYATDSVWQKTSSVLLAAPTTSWISPELMHDIPYRFTVKAVDIAGNEDINEISVTATPVDAQALVAAYVKFPKSGRRIKGNRFMISAGLYNGNVRNVEKILFQYRPKGSYDWIDVAPATTNHPNPDFNEPWFMFWDMTPLVSGQFYELRAVAFRTTGVADPAPPTVMIVYDTNSAEDDISSLSDAKIYATNKIMAVYRTRFELGSTDSNSMASIDMPAKSISSTIDSLTIKIDPANIPPFKSFMKKAGLSVDVYLANGQKILNSTSTLLTLSYSDENNDDKEDITGAPVSSLKIYSFSNDIGDWREEGKTTINRNSKTITASIGHFSYFGVFAAPQDTLDAAHVFPNPFKPNSNLGHIYINFTDLTAQARIRVYNIAGELVYDVTADSLGGNIAWDVRNNEGSPVASGVYIYLISNDKNETKKGKLAIIR